MVTEDLRRLDATLLRMDGTAIADTTKSRLTTINSSTNEKPLEF